MKCKIKGFIKSSILIGICAVTLAVSSLGGQVTTVHAYQEDESEVVIANSEQKNQERAALNRYFSDLKSMYDISEENLKEMERIYQSAMSYMQNASLTYSELTSYRSQIEGYLKEASTKNSSSTESFLVLSDIASISSASYGETAFVPLSFMNLGKTDVTDLVVTPHYSNSVKEWPFVIDKPYSSQVIQIVQHADNVEEAFAKRMDIGWTFTVRDDVLTGCYPLDFDVVYYQDGAAVTKTITTYINIKGSDPKRTLLEEDSETISNTSKPRIIVTGFTTDPEVVYAGSTFTLNVTVQNTSNDTPVENVLFELKANVESGSGSNTESYDAFLPTSGSSSIYTERIAPGASYDISIEMEAKADLAQKPYVLTVSSDFYYDEAVAGTSSAEVSIPVKQEMKMDMGTIDVAPASIEVGRQSNIMFSVFNTGKTTLYNVMVTYEGEGIESGITYLGNIASGETGNVDSYVTGIAPNYDTNTITAIISYEDESGNITETSSEISLSITEAYVEEEIYDDPSMYEVEEEASTPVWIWIVAGCVAAVVIIVIIVVVIKKRKAKKLSEQLSIDDEDDEI